MSWARRAGPLLGAAESGRGPDAKPIALLGRWMDIWSIYLSLSVAPPALVYGLRGQGLLLSLRRLLSPSVCSNMDYLNLIAVTRGVLNDGFLGFALVFYTLLVPLCFLPTSQF